MNWFAQYFFFIVAGTLFLVGLLMLHTAKDLANDKMEPNGKRQAKSFRLFAYFFFAASLFMAIAHFFK